MVTHFYWLLENKLAGMAEPGKEGNIHKDLDDLTGKGINIIVSLTEAPLPADTLKEFPLEVRHIPIVDGATPTISQITEFINYVDLALLDEKKIAVHCLGGTGRTGTVLACYLVSCGYSGEEAIRSVREKRPLSIETPAQERIIYRYANYLKNG